MQLRNVLMKFTHNVMVIWRHLKTTTFVMATTKTLYLLTIFILMPGPMPAFFMYDICLILLRNFMRAFSGSNLHFPHIPRKPIQPLKQALSLKRIKVKNMLPLRSVKAETICCSQTLTFIPNLLNPENSLIYLFGDGINLSNGCEPFP